MKPISNYLMFDHLLEKKGASLFNWLYKFVESNSGPEEKISIISSDFVSKKILSNKEFGTLLFILSKDKIADEIFFFR